MILYPHFQWGKTHIIVSDVSFSKVPVVGLSAEAPDLKQEERLQELESCSGVGSTSDDTEVREVSSRPSTPGLSVVSGMKSNCRIPPLLSLTTALSEFVFSLKLLLPFLSLTLASFCLLWAENSFTYLSLFPCRVVMLLGGLLTSVLGSVGIFLYDTEVNAGCLFCGLRWTCHVDMHEAVS